MWSDLFVELFIIIDARSDARGCYSAEIALYDFIHEDTDVGVDKADPHCEQC